MTGCANLGVLYDNGQGVTQDKAKAAALYGQACDGGSRKAASTCRSPVTTQGCGGRQDEAAELRKKSCDLGYQPACK